LVNYLLPDVFVRALVISNPLHYGWLSQYVIDLVTLSLQDMPEKIWIKLGWNGNSEHVATSIRCTDEQRPLDIDDLKGLCQQKLQECTSVGKTQMTVFADEQASECMDPGLEMETAKEKYPSIGQRQKPFVIIISASGAKYQIL
jgi:hypothetical protein